MLILNSHPQTLIGVNRLAFTFSFPVRGPTSVSPSRLYTTQHAHILLICETMCFSTALIRRRRLPKCKKRSHRKREKTTVSPCRLPSCVYQTNSTHSYQPTDHPACRTLVRENRESSRHSVDASKRNFWMIEF